MGVGISGVSIAQMSGICEQVREAREGADGQVI